MKRRIRIKVPTLNEAVSAIIQIPDNPRYLLLLAHGAGAGMEHSFMESLASALEIQKIGTLRFNFIYMEKGGGPDRPPRAIAAILEAVRKGRMYAEKNKIPLVAGGKSFGGRMFSHAAAQGLIPEVKGIIYFGFPLHAPGKPGTQRADHLAEVEQPMLFLQGTRDTLAQLDLITGVSKNLKKASIKILEGADHSFKTLKRSGISPEQMMDMIASETHKWLMKKLK
jgi:predicted alpha/beta-hydrolase family hydrolase